MLYINKKCNDNGKKRKLMEQRRQINNKDPKYADLYKTIKKAYATITQNQRSNRKQSKHGSCKDSYSKCANSSIVLVYRRSWFLRLEEIPEFFCLSPKRTFIRVDGCLSSIGCTISIFCLLLSIGFQWRLHCTLTNSRHHVNDLKQLLLYLVNESVVLGP